MKLLYNVKSLPSDWNEGYLQVYEEVVEVFHKFNMKNH